MDTPIVQLDLATWRPERSDPAWTRAVESGKVLFLPALAFRVRSDELPLLRESMLAQGSRNVSLDEKGVLKGAAEGVVDQALLKTMIGRFRAEALQLAEGLFPSYQGALRVAPTSFRPKRVETRAQSVRADDKRLHVDAFPTRPNYGERILRVFANINPGGAPRVWRVGADFEAVARQFLPRAKPYRLWQARVLQALRVTKSLRSEYDHLMLQLHDGMKRDDDYQSHGAQTEVKFPAGSVWVCFSDQAVHAAMGGQFMMEQTLHLPAGREATPAASPLAILTRLVGRPLTGISYATSRAR